MKFPLRPALGGQKTIENSIIHSRIATNWTQIKIIKFATHLNYKNFMTLTFKDGFKRGLATTPNACCHWSVLVCTGWRNLPHTQNICAMKGHSAFSNESMTGGLGFTKKIMLYEQVSLYSCHNTFLHNGKRSNYKLQTAIEYWTSVIIHMWETIEMLKILTPQSKK